MQQMKRIKVLVADNSIVHREILSRGLSTDAHIKVVATGNNAFDVHNRIASFEPDVIILDIGIPKKSYLDFIRSLVLRYSLPVIAVSRTGDNVHDAMDAGAACFAVKPDLGLIQSVERYIKKMISNVRMVSAAGVPRRNGIDITKKNGSNTNDKGAGKIIAIGASVGGTEAIYSILKHFHTDTPGITIVQHIPPDFSRMFAERLNASTQLSVKEAQTGDYIERGKVLIAPGDMHMAVRKAGNRYKVECYKGDKVNGHRPSADVLFKSVAKAAGDRAVGIILTGMGNDGAGGLLAMRKAGAGTIGQDKNSSVVYGMPKVAFEIGAIDKQAPLEKIPGLVYSFLYHEVFDF